MRYRYLCPACFPPPDGSPREGRVVAVLQRRGGLNAGPRPEIETASTAGLHSFSRGIPKDTLSLGKGPPAYPTYPRIVTSAGRAPRRYPTPRTVSLGPRGGALFDVAMCKR